MWKTFNNKHIDNLEETILTDISNAPSNDLTFIVGADSQWSKGRVTYTVAIILLMNGKGGKGYHKTIVTNRNHNVSIKQRLFTETYQAVEVAMWLNPILEQLGFEVSEVHADLNPNPNYPSAEMVSTCLGYIKGMGFEGKIKPDSWAASCTADKFTK
jgi:hypothetical protein